MPWLIGVVGVLALDADSRLQSVPPLNPADMVATTTAMPAPAHDVAPARLAR